MNWVVRNIRWIMLVAGALTFSMIQAAFAPQAALRTMFGVALEGPVAEIVVRNWGALIALFGALLIYSAFDAATRRLVLVAAIVGKLVFIGLILAFGSQFLNHQAGIAIVVDLVMIALFASYLVGTRRGTAQA